MLGKILIAVGSTIATTILTKVVVGACKEFYDTHFVEHTWEDFPNPFALSKEEKEEILRSKSSEPVVEQVQQQTEVFKEEPVVVKTRVELALIFDQFAGRLYACANGVGLVDERCALYIMAEQLADIEHKVSSYVKGAISTLLNQLEKALSLRGDIRPFAYWLRDRIESGALFGLGASAPTEAEAPSTTAQSSESS